MKVASPADVSGHNSPHEKVDPDSLADLGLVSGHQRGEDRHAIARGRRPASNR